MSYHSIRLDETILMSCRTSFYGRWMPRYLAKHQIVHYQKCKKCRFLTFRQISQHPMVKERQIRHHSIRLGETILMSHRSSLYDHWLPGYSAKRQMAQYWKCKNEVAAVLGSLLGL